MPLGGGKTTLLNSLSGRTSITSGLISLDGQSMTKKVRKRTCYVLQQDIFLAKLTLWETLYVSVGGGSGCGDDDDIDDDDDDDDLHHSFIHPSIHPSINSFIHLKSCLQFAAMIYMPEKVAVEEKMSKIAEIIETLDLGKCRDTIVGDQLIRGLSGGERKRLSIACELLKDPDVMFMDVSIELDCIEDAV
jgi:ABC-type multidrug transport system ATPase subunit